MTVRTTSRLALAGAAVVAAGALAACGSGTSPPGNSGSGSPRPTATAPATTPSARFNAADVAFTTSMLRLEDQAAALASLAPAQTTTPRVTQFAAHLGEHAGQAQRMRAMMGQWGRSAPPPYSPGAAPPTGDGPGMMSPGDWDQMGRLHGAEFNDHFADAMTANRTAEIALCRAELSHGASPQAQALARAMLSERQSELTQIQGWQHQGGYDHDHDMMGR